VSTYFGSVNALQDISLRVNAGEVTCVLGDYAGMLVRFASGARATFEASRTIIGPESHGAFDVSARSGGWERVAAPGDGGDA